MSLQKKEITDEQLEICKKFDVQPLSVLNKQMIVISEGVFEGDPVEGVRYPSPQHMSGWWITTDKFNGDSNTLRTEHVYHLLETRPELVKFLALPFGFRFKSNVEEVWFDQKVADSKP